MSKNGFVKITDAYRHAARSHPVIFVTVNIILVIAWSVVIMRFSGESASVSGGRSAKILVGLVNAVAPSANVTLENYETVSYLHNSERVVRKLAHMAEYSLLALLVCATLFGFSNLSRKYAYIIPVLIVLLLGITDEKNQTTVAGRYGSWFDVCVDTASAILTVTVVYRLTKRYRRLKRESNNPSA